MKLFYTSNRPLFNVVKSEALMFISVLFLISTLATIGSVYTALWMDKLTDDSMIWILWIAAGFWAAVLVLQMYLVGHLVYRPKRPNIRV
jgi:uncharacterized transporter YbjL